MTVSERERIERWMYQGQKIVPAEELDKPIGVDVYYEYASRRSDEFKEYNWPVLESPKSWIRGFDFWDVLGCPKTVCAPMVDQSELPFRLLVKRYGCELGYTPMMNCNVFNRSKKFRGELTTCQEDRPVFAQFAAHSATDLLQSVDLMTSEVEVDAIDLNLGCPQHIAKRGLYGSFLQDDWPRIYTMVRTVAENRRLPICVKIRVFGGDDDKTVAYAKMIQAAGAAVLCVHGRTRDNKGKQTTPADWGVIKKVKQALTIPVIANGNIDKYEDVARCMSETGADAVMSAETLRRNPALFSGKNVHACDLVEEYFELVAQHGAQPEKVWKNHLFRMLREPCSKWEDLRSTVESIKNWDDPRISMVVKQFRERIDNDAPPVLREVSQTKAMRSIEEIEKKNDEALEAVQSFFDE